MEEPNLVVNVWHGYGQATGGVHHSIHDVSKCMAHLLTLDQRERERSEQMIKVPENTQKMEYM
jgi:hypothetical protein